MVDDSLMQQQFSSVENGEVRDEDEAEGSIFDKASKRNRTSVASESEVREDEDEYAYTDPFIYSRAASQQAIGDLRLVDRL